MAFDIPRLRLGVVPYFNVQPLVYGLAETYPNLRLAPAPPSRLSAMLETGVVDLGIAPVAALFSRQGRSVLAAPAIACHGAVRSVLLVSRDSPVRIRRIYRDPDSATSNLLAAVLARRVWGEAIEMADWTGPAPLNPGTLPSGCGAVIIGDRALRERDGYPRAVDLGQAWLDWTGLPFVFAAWIGRADVETGDLGPALWRILRTNQGRLEEVAQAYAGVPEMPLSDRLRYLTKDLCHAFGPREREGLERFVDECETLGLASLGRPIRWIGASPEPAAL